MQSDRFVRRAQDRAYFVKREAEERAAAARSDGKAREAHEDMARRYRARLDSLPPDEQPRIAEAVPVDAAPAV
jgi:hypothetical protein